MSETVPFIFISLLGSPVFDLQAPLSGPIFDNKRPKNGSAVKVLWAEWGALDIFFPFMVHPLTLTVVSEKKHATEQP